MHPLIHDGLHLFLRWAHLIAGIMWIGSSIFFHWLDSHLEKVTDEKRPGLEGVLWMVHSGGFYEVEKKLVAPNELPRTLHWFKWEAGFTYLTGFFLLVLLYHLGGGAALVDPMNPRLSPMLASALCFGLMFGAWFVYDLLWSSPLAGKPSENPAHAVAISLVALAAIAFVLTHFLSGRAAYIHVAAVMGTCMVLNVWVRIIPAQRDLVESVKAGRAPDADKAHGAKRRSKHNHYLTYPVLFIMISNHFPSTYGALADGVQWNWIVLLALMAGGMVVKWWMNWKDPPASVMLIVLGVGVIAAAAGYALQRDTQKIEVRTDGKPITSTGRVRGVVKWSGDVPPPREVALSVGCEGNATIPQAIVNDGKLAEAFVHIASGVEGYAVPPVTGEVVVEQKGCLYSPRVVGARVGQPVVFVNDDPTFHNVRSVSKANETWSINQPQQGQRDTKVFRLPEVMVQTRCDVHPWMIANVGVKEHPWFAVTGTDGSFVLDGVPAGEVTIEVWHEAGGRKQQTVVVPADGEATLEIALTASP
jgi:uncharacterized membrane protein/plastocyanin